MPLQKLHHGGVSLAVLHIGVGTRVAQQKPQDTRTRIHHNVRWCICLTKLTDEKLAWSCHWHWSQRFWSGHVEVQGSAGDPCVLLGGKGSTQNNPLKWLQCQDGPEEVWPPSIAKWSTVLPIRFALFTLIWGSWPQYQDYPKELKSEGLCFRWIPSSCLDPSLLSTALPHQIYLPFEHR